VHKALAHPNTISERLGRWVPRLAKTDVAKIRKGYSCVSTCVRNPPKRSGHKGTLRARLVPEEESVLVFGQKHGEALGISGSVSGNMTKGAARIRW
jgi:hypothetical protein